MRNLAILCITALAFSVVANAQSTNHWKENKALQGIKPHKSVSRTNYPKDIKAFDLDILAFEQEMMSVVGKGATSNKIRVSFPNADGMIEEFELTEDSNFEPALQEQFPEIRAYSGKGITDPSSTIKVSLSPDGLQTMTFRADKENEFIEKYSDDKKTYAAFRSQRNKDALPWDCKTTAELNMVSAINGQVLALNNVARSGNNLKTMRLAQSCNAEYSNYFGATSAAQVGLVLAAFNATLTRCNGIYERDLALHLNLVAASTSVIYYNPTTDPYTTMNFWNGQLQSTLNSVITAANYDIGHMFGSAGGGGSAGCIGCVCVDATKGSGITSPADGIPQGDNFDIDYVAHEVGHQLGANHTFSMSNEGTGVNKEVGSGITIMGYAGITAQDVAPHSIDIFHQASIQQIQANLETKSCPVTQSISVNNTSPTIAPLTNYTIPISTPFALTANASDIQGDALTYCWEQNDNSTTTGAASVASPTKLTGPNWISFRPTTSGTRLFPRLETILAGGLVTGPLMGGDPGANIEALSSVARTLNFRVTVRDNAPYSPTLPKVGQTQFADVAVTVNATAGPFAVTAPNTAVSWGASTAQTVTWSVNSTNLAPINCENVKISLSIDGGLTFPTILAASTPNDGSEVVTLPNTLIGTARIKIEAIGNIFFDISNTNFTIGAAPLCGNATGLTTSSITTNSAGISWTAVPNATSYAVDYKLNTAATWTVLIASQTVTAASLTGLVANSAYNWRVRATCAAGTGNDVQANFTTLSNCGNPTGLATASITANSASISWAAVANATSYRVEFKTSAAATWTLLTASQPGNTASLTGLAGGTVYVWRVQATCAAGAGNFVQSANFTTTALSCASTLDNGTNNTSAGAAVIPFNTNVTGLINVGSDVDLYRFTITTRGTITMTLTTLPANYHLRLISANGTTVVATSSNAGTTNETISRTVTAGVYYARVYPGNTSTFNATRCYTLRVALGALRENTDDAVIEMNSKFPSQLQHENNAAAVAYPNPVNNMLTISLPTNGNDIALFNIRGEQVMKTRAAPAISQLDVSKLASGLYLVKISKDGRIVSQLKVIKQ